MQNQASTNARANAITLRNGMTDAERRLWSRLRGGQLGVKFRRQHPLGCYVMDFACLDPKLVIEIDGSQHLEQAPYDERRSAWLTGQGFRVLRFWSHEVLSETEAVVSNVVGALSELGSHVPPQAPAPALPQRGREPTESPPARK